MPAATSTFDDDREVLSRSPEETESLAVRLGRGCRGGEVFALSGPLGAGKTRFVKGLARGLAIDPREVTSPTFLLVHELTGRLRLVHLDAYRVGGTEELLELGAGELFAVDTVVAVEWPEHAPGLLPADRLDVSFALQEEVRRIRLAARGPRHTSLLAGTAPGEERSA